MAGQPKKNAASAASAEATDMERLRVNDLLVGLDDKTFHVFARRCAFIPFAAGDVLVEEGGSQDSTYLMVKGRVRVIQSDDHDVDVVYREIGEGGWFGEIAALDKGHRSAAVQAMTDGMAAAMPQAVFLNMILEHRQIAVKVLESLATVIRSSNHRFSEVSSFSGIQRVYLKLLELAEPEASGSGVWVIEHMPSHAQLAGSAMTSREAVARALSQIFHEGVAKRSSGKLKIINRDVLKRLATQI